MHEITRLLLAPAAVAVFYIFARATYLAFFHPYAKYPGPFLAKFTNAYAAYHGWKGDIHLDFWRCHEKYGDYVRYGPNQLTFNTAAGLRDIYGTGAAAKFIKADAYTPLIHRAPNTLTIRGGKDHARRRRIMAQGVSEKAQRGYEHRIAGHIDKLCAAAFSDDNGGGDDGGRPRTLDMAKWCYYLSFDIMSDVVFGARYNLLEDERFRYVTESIDKSNTRMSALIQWPRLAALRIDKRFFLEAIAARNRFIKFVSRVVRDRALKGKTVSIDTGAQGSRDADVFANLASAKDPETGRGFDDAEIAAESTTLIVAGSDTSSTALSGLFFYLANNREAYATAAAEVRGKFASRQDVVLGAALMSCTYLRACIDESLRMSPPVGSSLWREALPGGAVVVDSQTIPAGCDVGVPIYSVHHSNEYFTDPFEYRPERWLEDDGTGSVERARSVFNPFSIGTRSCLGKGLATTEIMLTMAKVLYDGDFEPVDGELGQVGRGRGDGVYGRHRVQEYQLWDFITAQKTGPILSFTARKDV